MQETPAGPGRGGPAAGFGGDGEGGIEREGFCEDFGAQGAAPAPRGTRAPAAATVTRGRGRSVAPARGWEEITAVLG